MKTRRFAVSALMLLSGLMPLCASAQVHRCTTMERDSASRAAFPYRGTLAEFESWMQDELAKRALSHDKSTMVVRTIPTVVHVIYSNASENISTAQVLSQMDVLNEDFRRLNADTVSTPSVFLPVAEDCQIEFCLAQQDPAGNPHNGIDRVSWSGSPFSDTYVDGTIKPATIWDPTRYFNIWVCNLSGGLLGWAQFPDASGLPGMPASGGAANTDGVVILHESAGRPPANPFPGPYNLGRTATHEVGHWLGLRHIWGDGGCSADDFCADTPDSDAANFGCPNSNGCVGTPIDYNDMVENYMDYTDDDCMNIFTINQSDRMDVVLSVSPRRASLLTSTVCSASPLVVANFTEDKTVGCAPLVVNFTNASSAAVTTWNWSFPGGSPSSSTLPSPTVTYSAAGTYSVTLIVTDGVDSDTLVKPSLITVSTATPGSAIPFTEDFESGGFTAGGWTINNPDGSNTWDIITVGGSTPGTKAARMRFHNYTTLNQRDEMVSKAFDFSAYATVSMDFDHAYRRRTGSGTNTDSLNIYVSVCDGPWTKVLAAGENGTGNFATVNASNTEFTPSTASQWCHTTTLAPCFTVDLTAFAGNQNVKIKFESFNRQRNNLFIDNINITGTLLPAPVANFSASDVTVCAGTPVTFTDLSTNSPTSWSWTFTGGSPSSSTISSPTVTYFTPGTYAVSLTATNAGGSDSETKSGYITVYANPSASGTSTATTCGFANGSASISVSGGSPSYTYIWSSGATSATASSLAAGSYSCTVTDANGCKDTVAVSIGSSTGITSSISSSAPDTCSFGVGSATVSASGGSGYTYLWSNGQTSATATGLLSGTYTVTVTSSALCTSVSTVTIGVTGGPSLSGSSTPVSCNGAGDGTATVNATGGTPGYTYNWSSGATTATATGLGGGSYSVTVTDLAGCTSVTTVTVTEPSAVSGSSSSTGESAAGAMDGTATVVATGGTPPYTYLWNTVPPQTTATATGLAAGSYLVYVTDANGCQWADTVIVPLLVALAPAEAGTFNLFPNPTSGQLSIEFILPAPASMRADVYDHLGKTVMTQEFGTVQRGSASLALHPLADGVYFVRFSTVNGVSVKKVIVRH